MCLIVRQVDILGGNKHMAINLTKDAVYQRVDVLSSQFYSTKARLDLYVYLAVSCKHLYCYARVGFRQSSCTFIR